MEEIEKFAKIELSKHSENKDSDMIDMFVKGAKYMLEQAWGYGTLSDWYQASIDNTIPPIWTDEHLDEIFKDFYLIKK